MESNTNQTSNTTKIVVGIVAVLLCCACVVILAAGFMDTFRHFHPDTVKYSWWSYRANARANNKGWRLDYGMVARPLEPRLKRAVILSEAYHSDHCPVLVELDD